MNELVVIFPPSHPNGVNNDTWRSGDGRALSPITDTMGGLIMGGMGGLMEGFGLSIALFEAKTVAITLIY